MSAGGRGRGGSAADEDRGQLILVGAVAIALVFVALALVFNTAIYTSTLATQGSGTDGSEPLAYEGAVADGVGGVLHYANYYNHTGGYGALANATRNGTRRWSGDAARHTVATRSVTVSRVVDTTNGTQILQDENATFANATGATGWTLARDVSRTRRFSMRVNRSSLQERSVADDLLGLASEPFHAVVTDGSTSRYVFVYEDQDTGDTVVQVENGSATVGRCTDAAGPATLDLTGGTVDGEPCAPLAVPGPVGSPYDIEFVQGDLASGRYSLVVDVPASAPGIPDGSYNGLGEGPPYAVPGLYSATVDLTYESAGVHYTTRRTVAPPSPPQGDTYGVNVAVTFRRLVYVQPNGLVRSIEPGGTPRVYDSAPETDIDTVGSHRYDLDGDGRTEVPFVNTSSGRQLTVIDDANETQQLAPAADTDAIAVGTWQGSDPSVFYANRNDNQRIYRANPAEGEVLVKSTTAGSVAGIAPFAADDDQPDLVFLGTSATVSYVDDNGTVVTTGFSSVAGQGAIGFPHDFDGDGTARLPYVDGSGNVRLVDASKDTSDKFASNATKTAVTPANVDGDPRYEIVYVDSNGRLAYVDLTSDGSKLVGTAKPLYDAAGNRIDAESTVGVA